MADYEGNGLAAFNDARSRGWSGSVTLADLEKLSAGNPIMQGIAAVWPDAPQSKPQSSVDWLRQYLPASMGDWLARSEVEGLQWGKDMSNPRNAAGEVISTAMNLVPMGRLAAPRQGIRAYHVSPYDFDRFSMDKIGEGQGAQSYGHGLYFAENPKVSGGPGSQYWNEFSSRFTGRGDAVSSAVRALHESGGDRAAAISKLEGYVPYDQGPPSFRDAKAAEWWARSKGLSDFKVNDAPAYNGVSLSVPPSGITQQAIQLLRSGKPVGPVSYEVNINAKPEQFLDWDRPIGQQSADVQQAVRPLIERTKNSFPRLEENADLTGPLRGQDFYRAYSAHRAHPDFASEGLRDAGIPGIRYLDQGSRNTPQRVAAQERHVAYLEGRPDTTAENLATARQHLESLKSGEGTSNYVLFNDKIVDIMKKWSLAGAIPFAAASDYDGRF